tara:strand:- start:136 stop:501 length:366 start_codon:yes stop_codon:yes gene_type:complete
MQYKNEETKKTTITREIEPYWNIEYVQYNFLDSELKDYVIEKELYSENRNYYYLFKKGLLLTHDASQNREPLLYNTLKGIKRRIELDLEDSDYGHRESWIDPVANYVSRPLYLNRAHNTKK